MQKVKCKKCGKIITFEQDAETVVCSKCGAKYSINKVEKKPSESVQKPIKKSVESKPKKKKSKIRKPLITLISLVVIVAIVTSTLFFIDSLAPANPKVYHKFVKSTFNGSYDGEHTPNDYYQVQIQKDKDTGEVLYSFIDVHVSTVGGTSGVTSVSEIWINFSDVEADELTITLSKGYELKTYLIKEKTYSRKDIKKDEDGWFRLYLNEKEGLDVTKGDFLGQLRIGFSASVRVREIVVLDTNKDVSTLGTANGSDIRYSVGPKPTTEGVEGYTKVTTAQSDETLKNIKGESSTFPFLKVEVE